MLMLLSLALILSFLGNIFAEKDSTQCQSVSVSYGPDVAHGTFKSPGFPLHYCNNLKSDYEIEPKSEHGVSLSIEFFDTEPLHDFVEVHQMFIYNATMSFAKQHVLSGPMGHQPRHFMSGMGGGLKIFFTTDTTENSYSGFQMSFTRFNKEHSHHVPCPFPFYEAGNTLQTLPTLKKTYYHDTSCVIRINSTDAVKLKIRKLSTVVTLKLIETENFKSNRVHDVLENLNGFTTDKLPYEVSSRTESLLLLFSFSGVINDEPAYEIDYEHAVSVCTCGESRIEVNSTVSKVFVSPGYPLEYCDFLNCPTKVSAMLDSLPPGPDQNQYTTVVQIIFNDFSVEIDVDFLQLIYKVPLLNLSDVAKGISTFTFDYKQIDLKFVSDHSVVERGFNLSLKAYKKPYYCQCPDSPKILASESYEQNHTFAEQCKYMDCIWKIYPPSLENIFRIVMKVNYRLHAESEFIEISNGENLERNNQKLRLESDAIPDDGDIAERYIEFDAGENPSYVQIWYHRQGDDNAGERVFNFDYTWGKRCQCGSTIKKANSEDWLPLKSPDYPTPYCNNMTCTWLIEAPPQHRVVINITDFLTEIDQDFLVIFDGNTTNTTHLEFLSGMEQFEYLITTKSNLMTIEFSSDISLSLRGFSLLFKAEPTDEYHRQYSGIFSKIPFFALVMLAIILAAIGTLIYLVKTHKLDSNSIDLRSIRFINRDRQRTESESSLMNPVFRPLSTNLR